MSILVQILQVHASIVLCHHYCTDEVSIKNIIFCHITYAQTDGDSYLFDQRPFIHALLFAVMLGEAK